MPTSPDRSRALLSQRRASALLGDRLWIPRGAATRLLNAGLAGQPFRGGGAVL